jgi:hypothetical protein
MESLPQELIDKVIDNLPHSSLRSCSLVGRRWRRRSQKRFFASIEFSYEHHLVRWWTKIPRDPGGIPSYVRYVRFMFHGWNKPALFGRVLKTFTSMTSLFMLDTTIPPPHELPGSVSFGKFGKKTKVLVLVSPHCTVATITTLVLSLPNLESFFLFGEASKRPPSILPHASERRPLAELQLHAAGSGVGITLAQCGLTSRKLSLIASDAGLERLLTLSSEIIVELRLHGVWPSETIREQERYSHVSQIRILPIHFRQSNLLPPFLFPRCPPFPL